MKEDISHILQCAGLIHDIGESTVRPFWRICHPGVVYTKSAGTEV